MTNPAAVDPGTIEKLNEQPWKELFIQMDEYTNTLLKRYQIRHPDVVLPKGYDAQMVIDEAVEKVYTGQRRWDFKAKPDFRVFITTQVIRSIVFNLYASKESQLLKELILPNDDDDHQASSLELLIADENSILENIYEKEFLEKAEQWIRKLDTSEQLLMTVYKGRLDGMTNQQLARQINVDIRVIEAAIKRLRRILLPFNRPSYAQ